MKLFTIKCHQCGDQNPLNVDEMASISVHFDRGSPNILDRMTFYCNNCGNRETHGIKWPLDIIPRNETAQPAVEPGVAG